ncbi:MAG: hypothetical protein Kow00121_58260 [Elainellaceae cyanobacterium]
MSKKLQAVQIDPDTTIYIEATEGVEVPSVTEEPVEQMRGGQKGWMDTPSTQIAQSFQAIENTIKTYTKYTLNAFRDAALADVEKVTLEFGVNVSGEGGVPYIATGTMGCNIKITVECALPDYKTPPAARQTVNQQQSTRELPPIPRQPQPAEFVRPAP